MLLEKCQALLAKYYRDLFSALIFMKYFLAYINVQKGMQTPTTIPSGGGGGGESLPTSNSTVHLKASFTELPPTDQALT